MISRFQRNGGRPLFFFKSLYQYSTAEAPAAETQNNLFVDCLTDSLGFSKQEAVSLLKKNPSKCCRRDPNLVLNFLVELGLNKNQIKSIISVNARVLSYHVDETLKPKIRIFQDLGLSESDLIRVIMYHRCIFTKGRSSFLPAIEYLRKLLGTDENVAKAITKFTPLLNSYITDTVISANVELLKRAGFSNEQVTKFVVRHPRRIVRKPEMLEENLRRVEGEFGISPGSKMFYRGVEAVSSSTETTINLKLKAFTSYGWNHADTYKLIRTMPSILGKSDAKIRQALSFYMEVLGYSPEYMASRPVLFTLSLERRVKPRTEVLKILDEKRLSKKKPSLYHAWCMSEFNFVETYILPYQDELPGLYKSYMSSTGRKIEEWKALL